MACSQASSLTASTAERHVVRFECHDHELRNGVNIQ